MNWLSKLLKKEPDAFETLRYRHSVKYARYMANPVAAEKHILVSRGTDAYNVGHTTRASEIETMTRDELRNAAQQLDDHLCRHKTVFSHMVQKLQERREEADRLTDDLRHTNNLILSIETQIAQENKEDKQDEEDYA